MKNVYISIVYLICTMSLMAQNKTWILPKQYFPNINFSEKINLPTPTSVFGTTNPNPNDLEDGYDGQQANFTSNIQTDANGNLLFFIVDGYVFDGQGNSIGVLKPDYIATGFSEIAIMHVPGSCSKYYIFSSVLTIDDYDPYVFTLDMSLPNPKASEVFGENCRYFGALTDRYGNPEIYSTGKYIGETNKNLIQHFTSTYFAITPERNDGSHFVFLTDDNQLITLKVDANGIEKVDSYIFNYTDSYMHERGEMEVAVLENGKYRIAFPYSPNGPIINGHYVNDYIFTADISEFGSVDPNSINRFALFKGTNNQNASNKGLEFDQNGSKLYVTHTTNNYNPNAFEYIDFNANSLTLTPILNPNTQLFNLSMIERAFDNQLMIATADGLYKLNDMSNPSSVIIHYSTFTNFLSEEGYQNSENDRKLYLIQDQIDGTDYHEPFVETEACCIANKNYDINLYIASESTTWEDNVGAGSNPILNGNGNVIYVKQELKIPAGITLKIKNMELRFAKDARLVVENGSLSQPGGRLILDGTKLTSDIDCNPNTMWLGVEVWGNRNLPQTNNQGQLELRNGSTIENASIGVLVSARATTYSSNDSQCHLDPIYSPFTFLNQRNGGIVTANVGISYFKNNQRDVFFKSYMGGQATFGPNNKSKFVKTQFTWDDELKISPIDHAKLEEVKGVSFSGCYFANLCTVGSSYFQIGTGIFSRNSQFYVNVTCDAIVQYGQPCPTDYKIRSEFIDMSFGILTTNSNGIGFTCNESKFTRNRVGIYAIGSTGEKITSNEFEVRESDMYQTSGIVLTNSSEYSVEDNDLYDDILNPFPQELVKTYGIVVMNSGSKNNLIYRNRFRDLKIGGQSEGNNAIDINSLNNPGEGVFTMAGLKWKCNDFESNIYSHDMTLFPHYGEGRINYHQGFGSGSTYLETKRNAANNKFSLEHEGQELEHDFYMYDNTQELLYSYINAPRHVPDSYTTFNYNYGHPQGNPFDINQILWQGEPISEDGNACPSRLVSKIYSDAVSQLSGLKLEIENANNLRDGGDKQHLLDLIYNGSLYSMNEALQNASPYLSDEVLLAYIASNPPSSNLLQIILSNSPVSNQVAQALSLIEMPNGTANQIADAQVGFSGRTYLDFNINRLNAEFEDIFAEQIRNALLDEDSSATLDNLIFILKEENDLRRIESLMKIYNVIGDTSNYQETREDYLSLSNHCPYFLELGDLLFDMCDESSTCEALINDSSIMSSLENLRDYSPNRQVAMEAFCTISMLNDYIVAPHFKEAVAGISTINNDSDSIPQKIDLHRLNGVNVYPNPSTGFVNIDYPQHKSGTMEITVANLDGKIVSEIKKEDTNGERLDLSNLKKGFYIIKIKLDGEIIDPVKLELF